MTSGSLYLRAFLKVPTNQTVHNYDIVVLSNAEAAGGVAVSFAGAAVSLSNLAGTAAVPGSYAFPRGTWFCLEVALLLSNASRATSDLRGQRDATLVVGDGHPAGGYSRLAIGLVRASPTQPPTRILIDDLVVASSPLGCE